MGVWLECRLEGPGFDSGCWQVGSSVLTQPPNTGENLDGGKRRTNKWLPVSYSHRVQWVSGFLCKIFFSSSTLSQNNRHNSNRIKSNSVAGCSIRNVIIFIVHDGKWLLWIQKNSCPVTKLGSNCIFYYYS